MNLTRAPAVAFPLMGWKPFSPLSSSSSRSIMLYCDSSYLKTPLQLICSWTSQIHNYHASSHGRALIQCCPVGSSPSAIPTMKQYPSIKAIAFFSVCYHLRSDVRLISIILEFTIQLYALEIARALLKMNLYCDILLFKFNSLFGISVAYNSEMRHTINSQQPERG